MRAAGMARAEHSTVEQRPRIAAYLQSSGNAALIREILLERGAIAGEIRLDDDDQPAFDLAIVDPATLMRSHELLRRCRSSAEPVILPVLLVVDGSGPGTARVARELGETVDDILRIPATREELSARIGNLLRLRELSLGLHARYERADRALQGANRALRVLHAGNEVLVRSRDEHELLAEICRVITREERYELAWVGFVREREDPEIGIDAVAGDTHGYAERIQLTRSQVGGGPAWRAIDTGEVTVVEDLPGDPSVQLYRGALEAYGLVSAITLPIRPGSGAPGVLVIYSPAYGDFDDNERDVLARLAGNLEFGLNALRTGQERDRQKEAIRSLAYTDPLTGLPNRNYLVERLAPLLSEANGSSHVAVLFIDLDRFKIINDGLGHAAGDMVLSQVAQRLQQVIRPEDIVARQGGDEFIVVMAEPPRSVEWRELAEQSGGFGAAAEALAARLAARLAEPMIIEGAEHRLGASIGISLYPEHARDGDELIDCADTAMYAAKNTETHVRMYSEAISARRHDRLSMEVRLYNALERDEFRLHYQPVFDLASGAIEGVEALIRWPQSDGSWGSPGEFMPVAEETGLIVPLGEWVLRTAVAQRAEWLADGHDLMMAVNVSVRHLKQTDAIDGLLTAIGDAVDPTRIELEVTESGLMDAGDRVGETVQALHDRGFRVAVDDFGTGYSSLSRLQEMAINTLKIDKSFVADLENEGRGAVIARTIQQLADNLGFRALAEGIETERERQLLLDQGCRVGQGFLVSGAVPPEELIGMLGHRFGAEPRA
jgi:diguanylate cyclase (GGDEF)-like protein